MATAIKMLGEIALRVNDLPAMVKFYRDVIGLELMSQEETHAFFRIAEGFAGHTQVLALFDRSSEEGYATPLSSRTTIDHIAFTIDQSDFAAEDARLQTLGQDVSYAYHAWVQWRSLYVRDPEENTVELVCYWPADESDLRELDDE